MATAKHTPGPWEVTNLHDLCSPEVVGNGRNVAMVRQPFASDEEIAANASLIAAAPAMLEALTSLREALRGSAGDAICTCNTFGESGSDCPIAKAETAIKLAKGQE